ncbi:MAG: radical SAM family heme chaperone HemW [Paludibacter sp.]
MAGIYIHIPFCKKRCTYCDFYTEVAPKLIPKLVDSIVKELHFRKDYLQNATIQTIYFGGGTPSILDTKQFELIFEAIYNLFNIDSNAEISFEANPDDLTPLFFQTISNLPFNRISIGIQSFDDEDLKLMNRRHSGKEAIEAVKNAQKSGFKNISIDLIYGLPFQDINKWENQLKIAFKLDIQHISSYGLTYEEGTVLWKQRENGELKTVDDDTMNKMYQMLLNKMKQNGFEAYEISNFAKPGYRSKHNTSYWQQKPYIGVGPSAHSYNIKSRQWNISSIHKYISLINSNLPFFEKEELSIYDKYNDYIMVSLRTTEGLDVNYLEELFGTELKEYCLKNIKSFIENNKMEIKDGKIRLTQKGIMISNLIIMELFKI